MRLLKRDDSKDSIKIFHGMRVITILWVILNHTYFYTNLQAFNPPVSPPKNDLRHSQRRKSKGLRSGDRGGQAIGPELPIQFPEVKRSPLRRNVLDHYRSRNSYSVVLCPANPAEVFSLFSPTKRDLRYHTLWQITVPVVAYYYSDFVASSRQHVIFWVIQIQRTNAVLVAYGVMKMKETELNVFLFIFRRLWRLTPPFMFVIATVYILPHIGSGPVWKETVVDGLSKKCAATWWTNLLYINNFIPSSEMVRRC
ncbi:hypothetical protein AVEN_48630-1 [Araneus ventricosus]|uniref:Nose resistant to fluoxetine protein 6 n=1 Tax=Araneus ventricosus TaxID=182803 RepID=A0A4Y2UH01_ARAVE|nr:hypothetical protein AVEN_48630-1 [Araneus ventricosus]